MRAEDRQRLECLEAEWNRERVEADINDSRHAFAYWLVRHSGWKVEPPLPDGTTLRALVDGVAARASAKAGEYVAGQLTDAEYDMVKRVACKGDEQA